MPDEHQQILLQKLSLKLPEQLSKNERPSIPARLWRVHLWFHPRFKQAGGPVAGPFESRA